MRRLTFCLVMGLTACATPQTAPPVITRTAVVGEAERQQSSAITLELAAAKRVSDVHWRLARASVKLCPRVTRNLGLRSHSLSDYRKFREPAKAIGVRDAPSVAFVISGSPAEKAGLRVGDRLVSIEGVTWPTSNKGMAKIGPITAAWKGAKPLDLVIRREGVDTTLAITPAEICDYPIIIANIDELNAFSDGDVIVVYRRMAEFTKSDDELAMIVGHEMAHNTRRHRAAKERNAALGTLAGGLLGALVNQATGLDGSDFVDTGAETGALAYSQQFETEADYVGMYLVARAGYKIDNVEDMWRRMALQSVSKLDFTNTHPPDAQRYLGLAATREEIRAKQASGQPLLPNMKKKSQ